MAAAAAKSIKLTSVGIVSRPLSSNPATRALAVPEGCTVRSTALAQQRVLERGVTAVEGVLSTIRGHRSLLQQQLAATESSPLNASQLEVGLVALLAGVHTWAATPDGPYSSRRVDKRHAAAARATYSTALELSDSRAHTASMLVALSNLLRRTGQLAEAEATLRRAVAAARAASDPLLEVNAAAALASAIARWEGWSYREVEGLVQAVQRRLQECKPWVPAPMWTSYREVWWMAAWPADMSATLAEA